MNNRLIIIVILLQVLSVKSMAQEPVKDDLLKIMVARYGQATVSMPLPGAGEMDILSRNVSVSSLRDNKLEIVLSPLTVGWFISRKYNYRILENEGNKGIITAGTTKAGDGVGQLSYLCPV